MLKDTTIIKMGRLMRRLGALTLRKSRSAILRTTCWALHPVLGARAPLAGRDLACDFAKRTGAEFRALDTARTFSYGVPQKTFHAPATFVTVIPNGRVIGSTGAVITPEHRLLSDVSVAIALPDWRHPALHRYFFPKTQHIDGEVAVISSVLSNNYWHWMVDVLPRIGLLERAGLLPRVLIVNADLPFQKETLATLGIREENLLRLGAGSHVQVERLIVPSLPEEFCTITPQTINFLRQKFLVNEVTSPKTLIYLSRKDAARRIVLNEDPLFARLEPLGFKRVYLSRLSVAEQAQVFANARAVVCPHGAGCTNMVFATPGSSLLEFMPDAGNHPSFEMLTSLLGCKYARVEYTGPLPAPADVTADVDTIMQRVDKLLQEI